MKISSVKRYGIAFLLVLVFFQQIGAGLYIHNKIHKGNEKEQTHDQHKDAAREINFTCSCVDNFLTPFIETSVLALEPATFDHTVPVGSFSEHNYFTSLIFSSLRGPPVFIG